MAHGPRGDRVRGLVLLGFSLGLLGGCGEDAVTRDPFSGNQPPNIRRIGRTGTRALTHENIVVFANVVDAEDDPLSFLWSATGGSFPFGRRSSAVTWRSPDTPGTETVDLLVWDFEDTSRASLDIAVNVVAPPESLQAFAGATLVELSWKRSPDDGREGWKGYEVYVAPRSFASIPAESLDVYRVSADSIGEDAFRVTGLSRGRIYWFRVGSLRGWEEQRERSALAAEADAAPRPEWSRQLQELNYPFGPNALDLSTGDARRLVPGDAANAGAFDVYFGTSDPLDGPGPPGARAAPRLKSVSELADRNPAWAGRVVEIKEAGTVWEIPPVADEGWSRGVDLREGGVYVMKTPEGNYAKLQVLSLVGEASPYRQCTVRWAYQLIRDYPKL